MTGIYKITNKLNGKIYVGQSVDIHRRWAEHKKNSKDKNKTSLLYQAMRADGIENFSFEIIEECSKESLNEREKYWINEYNTIENGYNMNIIDNLQYKINWKIAKEIMDLLKQNKMTMKEIAKIYDVSHSLISLINSGIMWHEDGVSYPIRATHQLKKTNTCLYCGKIIDQRSKYCIECYHSKNSIESRIDRNELKTMIRTKKLSEVSEYYKVSAKTIKRWCNKFNLPDTKTKINSYSDGEWDSI